MTEHFDFKQHTKIADQIIDNAIELPLENQEQLLMMAKAMQYTRNCVLHQGTVRSQSLAAETDT